MSFHMQQYLEYDFHQTKVFIFIFRGNAWRELPAIEIYWRGHYIQVRFNPQPTCN